MSHAHCQTSTVSPVGEIQMLSQTMSMLKCLEWLRVFAGTLVQEHAWLLMFPHRQCYNSGKESPNM